MNPLRNLLDSAIWLEDDATRIVWITLVGTMDEEGMAPFETIRNLASRANVTHEECEKALMVLMEPDVESGRWREFDGVLVEMVPGGFKVLNAHKLIGGKL